MDVHSFPEQGHLQLHLIRETKSRTVAETDKKLFSIDLLILVKALTVVMHTLLHIVLMR